MGKGGSSFRSCLKAKPTRKTGLERLDRASGGPRQNLYSVRSKQSKRQEVSRVVAFAHVLARSGRV